MSSGSISCCSLRWFPIADPCVLQFVGVGVGTCSRHSLHHTGYTGKNTPRTSINFTVELEENGKLPFLGMNVIRNGCRLDTTVYRKPTDTGLLLHYHSHVDARYKRSLLNTMLNRAFKLSSTWEFFHEECERLKEIFSRVRYPDDLCSQPFDNSLNPKCPRIHTPKWLIKEKPQSESCCPSKTRNQQT